MLHIVLYRYVTRRRAAGEPSYWLDTQPTVNVYGGEVAGA